MVASMVSLDERETAMTDTSADIRPGGFEGPVPVEHRLLGLDRRLLPATAAVLAVVVLWAVIVPWIASAMSYDNEVAAGTTLEVGADVVFTPTPGWEVDPRAEGTVILHNAAVTFSVSQGSFSGDDLGELLAAVNEVEDVTAFVGPQNSITTKSGLAGLTESFQNHSTRGSVTVFAENGIGIEVLVMGPQANVATFGNEIDEMISSIRFEEAGS